MGFACKKAEYTVFLCTKLDFHITKCARERARARARLVSRHCVIVVNRARA